MTDAPGLARGCRCETNSEGAKKFMRKQIYTVGLVLLLSATLAFAQTGTTGGATSQTSTTGQTATPGATPPTFPPTTTSDDTKKDQDREKDKDKDHSSSSASVSDDTLRRQVREQLSTNPSLANINVDVNNANVMLTGSVPSKDDRKQAKELAK